MAQSLRLSQFILTWGPGSILEGPGGPRIILSPEKGLFYKPALRPDDFEISDQRISEGLLNGNRIFRLPSNAELGLPAATPIYRTAPFPEWKLCHNRNAHKLRNLSNFSVLFSDKKCPLCQSASKEHMEPVRFIMACPEGHLDDIPWDYIIHKNKICKPGLSWFIWTGTGKSLSEITIQCPICRKKINLGTIYRLSWQCSGRYPEKENYGRRTTGQRCNSKARIIQRQASNLRIPELRTLFTIPPRNTNLHKLLQLKPIYYAIKAHIPQTFQELEKILDNLQNGGDINQLTSEEIKSCPWDEIRNAINDIIKPVKKNYRELLLEEFHSFIDASINGIPPVHGKPPVSPVLIEVNPNKINRIMGINKKLRIVPVLKLRTVIVQKGYRREVDTKNPGKIVDISFIDSQDNKTRWYPGVEFFGEGIFIMLDDNDGWHFSLKGEDIKNWQMAQNFNYPDYIFREPTIKEEIHPVFVWWHTLSHLLIRAISMYAGYPSASIRERIYFENKEDKIRGGILLYAVQPGTDGTMGGLIALCSNFDKVFQLAINMLNNCSGDPLCYDNSFKKGHYCGAACYGCLFLSETSCEHRNMWLDRRILRKNMP